MCRFLFAPDPAEIARAQWALVSIFEQAAANSWRYGDKSNDRLRELVRRARGQGQTPQEWAGAFVRALLEEFDELEAAVEAAAGARREMEALRTQLAYYERLVADYHADPLKAQVDQLTGERDLCRLEVRRLTDRVQQLQESLARAQQLHQSEVDRLRQEIAALNRIVVEQQEELLQRSE